MERLTQWIGDDEERRAIPRPDIRSNGYGRCCNKLAEYEDAEERDLLLRLPCKIGNIVWDNDAGFPEPYEITAFSYGCHDLLEFGCEDEIMFYYTNLHRPMAGAFASSELGKTIFLTREEAEKKLEEMKNDKR